ncbi:MAG: nucleotidyltransferase [Caldilinea sp. CFX5]|nr:nucleotidyltransferase [Caldilinea sp. CFX5]
MQQMTGYFDRFRSEIEPGEKHKKQAQKADDPVREHLQNHKSFASKHITTFLYGSYRRNTAVGDIKDVDLVVVTRYTTKHAPVTVLNDLKASLANLYEEPNLSDQRRSIRIDRPLPNIPSSKLTLDVIPAIYQGGPDDPLWVPDREKQMWIPSHPLGHINYSNGLSNASNLENGFVRLTKMMKWWWNYQFEQRQPSTPPHERKPKGFWIEVMTGEYANLSKGSYPELIVALLENTFSEFCSFRQTRVVPDLPDPGLRNYRDRTHRTVKTSMTANEFAFFLNVLEESLGWARTALYAKNEREASEYWRLLFGAKFPLAPADRSVNNLLSPAAAPSGLSFPNKPVVPRKPGGFA